MILLSAALTKPLANSEGSIVFHKETLTLLGLDKVTPSSPSSASSSTPSKKKNYNNKK